MTDLIEHVDMWGDCSCDGFSIGHEAGCQRRIIEREGMTTNHAGIPVMAEVNQRLATEIRTGTHYGKAEQ